MNIPFSAVLRELMAVGVAGDDLVAAIERLEASTSEAPAPGNSRAERNRRYYEKRKEASEKRLKASEQDVSDVSDGGDKKVSPTPPSKNQTHLPPIPPLKGGTFPLLPAEQKPAKLEKPKSDDLAQRLWTVANKTSRDRSGRPALRQAVLAAVRKGATAAALEASVREHCREQGEFAKGIHRIIEGEHWRDHLPSQGPPTAAAGPEVIARRLQHFRDTGEWRPEWGENPRDAA